MSVFKKFISYYKPYQLLFWADMLCALIVSVVDLTFPQVLNFLTNTLFLRSAAEILSALKYIALGLLAMYLVRYACQYFITSWGHIMGARMESNMREDLFSHYQQFSFSYYDKNNTGEMMSKLVNDLFDVTELAHHGPENVLIAVLKLVGSFALLMFLNVPMTLILLAITVFMMVYCIYQNKKMHKIFMENRKKIAGVNSRVQDSLAGIRVVKGFANEKIEEEKFATSNDSFLQTKEISYKFMGGYQSTNAFFQGILYTAVLVSGGYFVVQGTLQPSDLAIYALYIGIFLKPIDMLIEFTEMLQKGYTGFKRFKDIMDIQPEIVDKEGAKPIENVQGNICFDHVSFEYDKSERVLQDVSLQIKSGKTIALVGPSGGGKTTICSLLPRFYDVEKGKITIDGVDIRDLTLESLRGAIGIVQQDVYMFGGTIRENIAYGKPGATQEEIVAAAKNANIHEFIMSLEEGYDTFVGERGARLSGGQKQRISIARVFLKNPKILVLDEATSALDNESEKHIQQSLEALSTGRTSIIIAHRLSTIRNADEIYVIENGSVCENGSHNELMEKDGLYAKYYNMQFENMD
ncbi:MAG: ABC transporter ATP-binding protein [Oscillospiraceae bacterium]